MNKIPTAEEFLQKEGMPTDKYDLFYKMIEFAKLHVTEALKKASEKVTITNDYGSSGELFDCIDKDSILNAYPLDLIK